MPGVPGGPIVSRVTIQVEVVGSNLTRVFLTDRQAESARAWVGEIRCKIDEHKKPKSGNAERTLCAIRKKPKYRGGEGKTPVTAAGSEGN